MKKPIELGLKQVNERIQVACRLANRSPSSVRLLAASKRTDAAGVVEAYNMGHVLFGENRAQSLRDKYDQANSNCPSAEWHFIGHLQKNKVKYVVGRATMIHTIDSFNLAEAISNRVLTHQTPPMKALVQVKYGNEASKTGIPRSDALALAHKIQTLKGIHLAGLMTIPPQTADPRACFEDLSELSTIGREEHLPLNELSMGMSGDLEDAIAAGSTIVRIGTAIFHPMG